jgi:two-component system response regulator CpxR
METAPPAWRILIVDDDRELCELLSEYLRADGFATEAVFNGEAGVTRALSGEFDAVILDVMLPGLDGFEVLRRVRASSFVPVLLLTARGDEIDRIVGLELGADDYLPKPFNTRELAARLRAIRRRIAPMPGAPGRAAPPLSVDDLVIDPAARTVTCGKREIELTGSEFALLERLVRDAGRVVSRTELSRDVFDRRPSAFDRSLDVHISNLRRKLGPRPGGGERIKTVRGHGYIYTVPHA